MFSEVVDLVVARAGRPDRIQDVQAYLHATIRELQVLAYFARDLVEDTLTADAAPYIWQRPTLLRLLRTARYPGDIYPRFTGPGKKQLAEDYYYYGGSNYYAFAGVSVGDEINVAYYSYARRFKYYAVGSRPAVYDDETQTWSYLSGGSYVSTLGSEALDEAARDLVTMWLLDDWREMVQEGVLAKLFKQIDDKRSITSYALYMSYQDDLKAGELSESMGV